MKTYIRIDQAPNAGRGAAIQIAIEDENGAGFRLAGPKYDGKSENLITHEITECEASEIRGYLDKSFPPKWQPIETAPEDGRCLLAIKTDQGWDYGVLTRDKSGHWIHEGEATFCHGYYYEPLFWMPLPQGPSI